MGRLMGEYYVEFSNAAVEMEKGTTYLAYIPILAVRAESQSDLRRNLQRAKDAWREQGFVTQEEKGSLQALLFLLSLPMGCSLRYKDLAFLDRHFVDIPRTIACMCPIVGEISGLGKPAQLFITRKGQLVTFDLFNDIAPSKNFIVMGTSGGGKSVNMNLLIKSMYSADAKVFIMDLGYSYLRLCKMVGGDYIDFSYEEPLCLNPFSFINPDNKEDVEGSLAMIVDMVLSIVFSGLPEGSRHLKKEHRDLVKYAVRYAWEEFGTEAGIDHIYEYLSKFPALCGEERNAFCKIQDGEEVCLTDFKKEAQALAFALHSWTSQEAYGKWFNGTANIDFSKDFIVLEMERLERNKLLMSIITMSCLHAVTANLYLTRRAKRKIILMEECGIMFEDAPYLTGVVKEAYRRVRKYGGAIGTVFQSPYDFHNIGPAAKTIAANTPYWFLLPCDQYEAVIKDPELKYFGFEEWEIPYLKSIQLVKPRYGEIYLRTPSGCGVVRTVLDGFHYYLITTDPRDFEKINSAFEKAKEEFEKEYGRKPDKTEERKIMAEVLVKLGKERDEEFKEKFLHQ